MLGTHCCKLKVKTANTAPTAALSASRNQPNRPSTLERAMESSIRGMDAQPASPVPTPVPTASLSQEHNNNSTTHPGRFSPDSDDAILLSSPVHNSSKLGGHNNNTNNTQPCNWRERLAQIAEWRARCVLLMHTPASLEERRTSLHPHTIRKRRAAVEWRSAARLPCEVLSLALAALPVNHLAACRLVCKEWQQVVDELVMERRDAGNHRAGSGSSPARCNRSKRVYTRSKARRRLSPSNKNVDSSSNYDGNNNTKAVSLSSQSSQEQQDEEDVAAYHDYLQRQRSMFDIIDQEPLEEEEE
eukprot:jgi/Chlat1/5022/Chrsp32S04991